MHMSKTSHAAETHRFNQVLLSVFILVCLCACLSAAPAFADEPDEQAAEQTTSEAIQEPTPEAGDAAADAQADAPAEPAAEADAANDASSSSSSVPAGVNVPSAASTPADQLDAETLKRLEEFKEMQSAGAQAARDRSDITTQLNEKKEEADAAKKRLEEARKSLSEKSSELEKLINSITDAEQRIEQYNTEITTLSEQLLAAQQEHAALQKRFANVSVLMYKTDVAELVDILVGSESITQLLDRMHQAETVASQAAKLAEQEKALSVQLQEQYDYISVEKDELEIAQKDLAQKQRELNQAIQDMELDVEQQEVALESIEEEKENLEKIQSQTEGTNAALFTTFGTDGWATGLATAYGGASDVYTTNPDVTATGDVVDDWSMGVAVPMVWNPGPFYGKYVEISYGGKSIIAVVNDCGGLANGKRSLDLQPGVFKAFGCSTCDEWGVRTVKFRFL